MTYGPFARRKKQETVRVASAIAIQKVWRKMRQFKKSPRMTAPSKAPQLDYKEVLVALEDLKQVRTAPVGYEQDFAARVESKMWDLNYEVDELKGEVKRQHEQLRTDVLKEMAVIQGRMVKAMVEEVRKATSQGSSPEPAYPAYPASKNGAAGAKPKNGSKKIRKKAEKKSDTSASKTHNDDGSGNVFSSMAMAKKKTARVRSRRLSRD